MLNALHWVGAERSFYVRTIAQLRLLWETLNGHVDDDRANVAHTNDINGAHTNAARAPHRVPDHHGVDVVERATIVAVNTDLRMTVWPWPTTMQRALTELVCTGSPWRKVEATRLADGAELLFAVNGVTTWRACVRATHFTLGPGALPIALVNGELAAQLVDAVNAQLAASPLSEADQRAVLFTVHWYTRLLTCVEADIMAAVDQLGQPPRG